MSSATLFDTYFQYYKDTEAPPIFQRWCFIGCLGAWLGRQVWFPFGGSRIFPNQYIMLIGDPGTRKSTAIKGASHLLRSAGYKTFSARRTSKEKFLMDLAGMPDEDAFTQKGSKQIKVSLDDIELLAPSSDEPREVMIDADEFNNYMGPANLEFQAILGELWDWDNQEAPYDFRLKNSKQVNIWQPTVSILGGNTPANFALCFPPASIGQGFMSRLLLILGESTGKKITFPEPPSEDLKQDLIRGFLRIRTMCVGPYARSSQATHMLDMIYKTWPDIDDQRFRHYSTRRFTHLIKLCMVTAAARFSMTIDAEDVLLANTMLAYAETLMPKALGELGKSRSSEAANKILQALMNAKGPMDVQELWKVAGRDLEKPAELTQVLANLQLSEQIQHVKSEITGKSGYMIRRKSVDRKVLYVDLSLLGNCELKK